MSPTAEGGEEIRVRTHTHFREAVGLGVFCLLWFGFIALMITLHSPLFLPIVFSAFGLILLLLLFDFAFGRTTIRATRTALTLRREWLGLHASRSIAPPQIESVSTTVGMTSGGGSGTPYYMVSLKIRGGGQAIAAKYIRSRRDAEMLAARIERDCGIDTAHT
jgi:hypothetical protein